MPKIVDKEAKRKEILGAAMRTFAKHGVVQTKMADIALAAGVGKGTIYEYYDSKEAIFMDAKKDMMMTLEASVARRLEAIEDPREKLKQFALGVVEGMEDCHEIIQLMLDFKTSDLREMQLEESRKACKQQLETVASFIDEGIQLGVFKPVDSLALSSAVLALLDGQILQWIIQENFSIAANVELAIDLWLQGLAT